MTGTLAQDALANHVAGELMKTINDWTLLSKINRFLQLLFDISSSTRAHVRIMCISFSARAYVRINYVKDKTKILLKISRDLHSI